jgi:pSer/pThr/pTyr-binding forkhead associated (FHA) protein
VDTFVYPTQSGGVALDIGNTIPKQLLENKDFILYYSEKEQVLNLPEQEEFSMGRIVEGQMIMPDVDLNPYGAFDKGVSRLHISIRVNQDNNTYHVMDLGSANGTSINGYDIPVNSEVPLNHGDVLSLGKFNLKVILPKELK